MLIKKLRLDIKSDDEMGKIIQTEICKIENNVRIVLANKDREVRENKIAFSAVAKENTEVKEQLLKSESEIEKKKGELAECYKAFQQKDEEIRNILDDNIKKESELNRYKDSIEKFEEKQKKYEIEKRKLLNELLNCKNENEELRKSNHLVKITVEEKSNELSGEKERMNNLENSFFVASYLFEKNIERREQNAAHLRICVEEMDAEIDTLEKIHTRMKIENYEVKTDMNQLSEENEQIKMGNKKLHDGAKQEEEKYKKQLNAEINNHESTKTKLALDKRNLENILEKTNEELKRKNVLMLMLSDSYELKESMILKETKAEIEKVEALRLSENKNNSIEKREILGQVKCLENRIELITNEKNLLSKDLETKNENLVQDLADRTKKHAEQTTELKAIITEKENTIERLQETMEEYSKMKDVFYQKDTVIENLQQTLDEQISAAEIQSQQNAIYRKVFEDYQLELARSAQENKNWRQGYKNRGVWLKYKQEEVGRLEADVKKKEDDVTGLALLLKESENTFVEFQRETQEKKRCKVCWEDDISVVFLPCGHLCCCSSCANLPAVQACPICRALITRKLRVFQS